MSDQNIHEIIEAYLNGDLEGAALSDFEARIQVDKELSAQINMHKAIDSAIGDKPVLNFQKLVADESKAFLDKKDQKNTVVRKLYWRRNLSIAASILFLAVALFIWQNQLKSPISGPELFVQHFEPYDLNASLRGIDDSIQDFEIGINKYQNGDFEEASTIFQKQSDINPSDMIVTFCLANAFLNQEPPKFTEARTEFNKVIQEGNSIYVPASKWYLALILLEQNKRSEAKNLLIDIVDNGGDLGEKAKQLLAQLN